MNIFYSSGSGFISSQNVKRKCELVKPDPNSSANHYNHCFQQRLWLFFSVKCLLEDKYSLFKSRYNDINKKSIKYTGFSLEKMSSTGYVKDIQIPTFYVQVKNDPWTKPFDVQSFYDNTPEPRELFWIEGDLKRFDGYNYFGNNPEKLLEFLQKYM